MPNFSFLAYLKVTENFLGVDGLAVSTVSNLSSSCIEIELGLGFDNKCSGV